MNLDFKIEKGFIHPTAIIYPNVTFVDQNSVYIGPYCIIGSPAEDKKRWGTSGEGVLIYENVVITGDVTVDEGTIRPTTVGPRAFLMKGVHIGHDCVVEEDVIMSPHVVIGGHCTVGSRTNMGISSVVHQRIDIPSGCMVGMNSTITKKTDLKENGCYIGSPAKWLRENLR